jgi:hypothetical protein
VVNALTQALGDAADLARVYDVTERAVRGARRRRRTRRVVWSAGSLAVVAVLGLAYAARLTGFESAPGYEYGGPPAVTTMLLDSPTRGSLAGDAGYLDAMRQKAVGDAEHTGLPADPAKARVLFAGDVPGGWRVAMVASVVKAPRMAVFQGSPGAGATQMRLFLVQDVTSPVVQAIVYAGSSDQGCAVVFGPAGYLVEVSSDPRYLADGTVERDWIPEPAGYVARDLRAVPPGLRVRLSHGTTVLYESDVGPAGPRRTAPVEPEVRGW